MGDAFCCEHYDYHEEDEDDDADDDDDEHTRPSLMKVSQMKMREMRKEKISWVKRETKRTRKLPSNATITVTMMMSQKPIQTRPVRYSTSLALQNWKHKPPQCITLLHDTRVSLQNL